MIDPVAALRALLLSDTALAAVLSVGLTTAHPLDRRVAGVPPGLGDDPPAVPPRCVLIQPMPGAVPRGAQFVFGQPFMLRCHGPDSEAAWTVYRAVFDVFYDASGMPKPPRLIENRWLLKSAVLSPPMADLEPDGWPVVAGQLQARFDAHRGANA